MGINKKGIDGFSWKEINEMQDSKIARARCKHCGTEYKVGLRAKNMNCFDGCKRQGTVTSPVWKFEQSLSPEFAKRARSRRRYLKRLERLTPSQAIRMVEFAKAILDSDMSRWDGGFLMVKVYQAEGLVRGALRLHPDPEECQRLLSRIEDFRKSNAWPFTRWKKTLAKPLIIAKIT